MQKIYMTSNHVLVRLDDFPEKPVEGGAIYQPDIAQERPFFGEVCAVGPGFYTKKGKFIHTQLKVKDRVCLPWGEGSELKIKGKIYMILPETKIMGVVQ